MKETFSERYGYAKVSDVIIREKITEEIQNAICNCYYDLEQSFQNSSIYTYRDNMYVELEKYLWVYFLNKRIADFYRKGYELNPIVVTSFIEDKNHEWYRKLDMLDKTISYLYALDELNNRIQKIVELFVEELNFHFKRLNFAYRVVDRQIVEITSEEEITSIETAISNSADNIKAHLNNALKLYAKRPDADYRNSIKESISAVEAYVREKTGENTLGKALKKLQDTGVEIPEILKVAFEKLYAYTNQPDTGIRHALMDDSGTYTPKAEEALFMIVSCSAFINYLRKK